ncbi:hypothetical protein FB566_0224 [Stackebrandtia endophytica]|uniref:Lipoprotein n=1 Tax=Stackebrandtia endophytica TaxID=1496996 RepID=A0A543AQ96_9ACTN|nr:hypothetical protein [Stackebrandtia endophytica]TQL74738.1 hypothetical protein FB566_0224 [Stackebrandtia endophytica]
MKIRSRVAAAVATGVGLVGLVGCAAAPIDTDDSGSIALVEEFFADLEAGKASEAAALTSMDFGEEFVDDDFYRASAAFPTDARIVETSGYDAAAFSAIVEFTLEGADVPATLEVRTTREGDELKISGWRGDSAIAIGPFPAAGTVTVNDRLEYVLAAEDNRLTLLPGAYSVEYDDPTGLLQLSGRDAAFTAYVPEIVTANGEVLAAGFQVVPTFMPDVEPGLYEAVGQLQAACAEEGFIGPSCPAEFTWDEPFDGSVTAEWFRGPGPEIRLVDGGYQATANYQVRFSNDTAPVMTVSYTGTIGRDASGAVTFTRL